MDAPGKPRYPLHAVPLVLEKGLKFVLVAPWGELDGEGKQLKKPIHKNYQKQRFGPGFQSVKDHIDRNGLLGILPESYRCGGIDVDRGDASAIVADFPPLLVTQSLRPGGLHLWYRNPSDWQPTTRKWTEPDGGAGGDFITGPAGYFVLWGDALQELADQLKYGNLGLPTADFRDVAKSLTPVDYLGRPAADGYREIPVVNTDLAQAQPGYRNTALFTWLLAWGYAHHQDYADFLDFLGTMQDRSLAGLAMMPDLGPTPKGGNSFDQAEALKVAGSASSRVWGRKRQGQDSQDYPPSANRLESALSAPDFHDSGQKKRFSGHGAICGDGPTCHHRAGQGGGDPALNSDPTEQSRRRSCRTVADQERVEARRQVVARKFVLGQKVATIAAGFGISTRRVQQDLAALKDAGQLPSRRQAKRQQAVVEARRRRGETRGSEGGQRSCNQPGREPTAGLLKSALEEIAKQEYGSERLFAFSHSPPGNEGFLKRDAAKQPPRVYGLSSLLQSVRDRDGPVQPQNRLSSAIEGWFCRGCGWYGPDLQAVREHAESVPVPEKQAHLGMNAVFRDIDGSLFMSDGSPVPSPDTPPGSLEPTERQLEYIRALMDRLGRRSGGIEELTRWEASEFIAYLQESLSDG